MLFFVLKNWCLDVLTRVLYPIMYCKCFKISYVFWAWIETWRLCPIYFLLFWSLKESTAPLKLRKMFLFHLRSSVRFWFHAIMKCQVWNMKYAVLKYAVLNTSESKLSLVMKFDQLFIKKLYLKYRLETSPKLLCACKELSTTSIGKRKFWNKLIIWDMK